MSTNFSFGVSVMDASEEARMYERTSYDRYEERISGFQSHEEACKFRGELAEALEKVQENHGIVFTMSDIQKPDGERAGDEDAPPASVEQYMSETFQF